MFEITPTIIFNALTLIGSLITVYVTLQTKITSLEQRVQVLEKTLVKLDAMSDSIHKIEVTLATLTERIKSE